MKSPIVFRATFEQPKHSAMVVRAGIQVEVYQAKLGEWRARRPNTKILFSDVTPQSTADQLMRQIELLGFERRISDWTAYDNSDHQPSLLAQTDWYTDQYGTPRLTDEYRQRLTRKPCAADTGTAAPSLFKTK